MLQSRLTPLRSRYAVQPPMAPATPRGCTVQPPRTPTARLSTREALTIDAPQLPLPRYVVGQHERIVSQNDSVLGQAEGPGPCRPDEVRCSEPALEAERARDAGRR